MSEEGVRKMLPEAEAFEETSLEGPQRAKKDCAGRVSALICQCLSPVESRIAWV
jgi:hypothetical protein